MGWFDDAKDFVDDTVDSVVDTVSGDNNDQNQDDGSGSGGSGGDSSSSGGYSPAPDSGSDSSGSDSSGTGDATPGEAGGGYSKAPDDPFGGYDSSDDDDDSGSSSSGGGSSSGSDSGGSSSGSSSGVGDSTPNESGGGYSEAQDDPFGNYDGSSGSGDTGNSGGSGDNTLRNTAGEIVGRYSPGGSLQDTLYDTDGSDNDSGSDSGGRDPVRGRDRGSSTDSGPEVVQAQDQGQPPESKTLFEGTTAGGNEVTVTRDYVRDPQTGEYRSTLVVGQSDSTYGQSQTEAVAAAARNRATEIGGIPGQRLSDFADKIDQVNSNFEDSEFQLQDNQLYISGENNSGSDSGGDPFTRYMDEQRSGQDYSAYQAWQRGDPLAADAAMTAPGDETPDFGYGDNTPEYYGRTQLDQPGMYQPDQFQYRGASRRALNRMRSPTSYGLDVQQDVADFTGNPAFGRAAGTVAATGYQAYQAPLAADAFIQQAARDPEKAVNQVKESLETTGRQIAGNSRVADDVQTAVMATPGSRLAEEQRFNEQLAQSQFAAGAITGAATGAAAGGAVRGVSSAPLRGDLPDYSPRSGSRRAQSVENQASREALADEAEGITYDDLAYMGESAGREQPGGAEPVRAPRVEEETRSVADRRQTGSGLEETRDRQTVRRRTYLGDDLLYPETQGEPLPDDPGTGFTQNEMEALLGQDVGFEDVQSATETGGIQEVFTPERRVLADASIDPQDPGVTLEDLSNRVKDRLGNRRKGQFYGGGQRVKVREPKPEVKPQPDVSPGRYFLSDDRMDGVDPIEGRPQDSGSFDRPNKRSSSSGPDLDTYDQLDRAAGVGSRAGAASAITETSASTTAQGTTPIQGSIQTPTNQQDEFEEILPIQEDQTVGPGGGGTPPNRNDGSDYEGFPLQPRKDQDGGNQPRRNRRWPDPDIGIPLPDPGIGQGQAGDGDQADADQQNEYLPSLGAALGGYTVSASEFDKQQEFSGLEVRPIVVDTEQGTVEEQNNGNGGGGDPLAGDRL